MFIDDSLTEQLHDLLSQAADFNAAVSALSEAAFRLAAGRDSEEWTSLVEAVRGLSDSPAQERNEWN